MSTAVESPTETAVRTYRAAQAVEPGRFPMAELPQPTPLLYAGITTFKALRNSSARTGDLVAGPVGAHSARPVLIAHEGTS